MPFVLFREYCSSKLNVNCENLLSDDNDIRMILSWNIDVVCDPRRKLFNQTNRLEDLKI